MNMIDIKIPAPPEGHEAFFNLDGIEVACTHKIVNGQWMTAQHGTSAKDILARKKRTLADWANEQELFKAFAKMRNGMDTSMHWTYLAFWAFSRGPGDTGVLEMGAPPSGLTGSLKLTNGKWELA